MFGIDIKHLYSLLILIFIKFSNYHFVDFCLRLVEINLLAIAREPFGLLVSYVFVSIIFSVGSSSLVPASASVFIHALKRNIEASTNTWNGCKR